MNLSHVWFKLVAVHLAALLFILSCPPGVAFAGLVSTEEVLAETDARTQRARLVHFLEREDVRAHMVRLGIPPREAIERVAALSDGEVTRIAGHLDTLPAGQHPAAIIVGAAALVFLVLLVTDLLGLTDIFPFVKKAK
jgi:hypothetical protein